MNNFQVLLAQIGSSTARARPRAMLLQQEDLVGNGWKVLNERSWRTGAWGISPTEAGRRARKQGLFSAARSFEQVPSLRWLSVEVIQFASVQDAELTVPEFQRRFVPNPKARVTVTAERKIEGYEVPGVPDPWIYEQSTIGAKGPGMARYVAANVDHVVFFAVCAGYGDCWPWDEVVSFAALQGRKIRSSL
jgi:hypothetical protein